MNLSSALCSLKSSNMLWQPLITQMESLRIRQLEELSDLTSVSMIAMQQRLTTICPEDSSNTNSDCVILPSGSVNSRKVKVILHSLFILSLLKEGPKQGFIQIKYTMETELENSPARHNHLTHKSET